VIVVLLFAIENGDRLLTLNLKSDRSKQSTDVSPFYDLSLQNS
jgi:hypothetical protein